MERILTAPYEERDGFELNVMCVDGVFYLEDHASDKKLREKYVDPISLVQMELFNFLLFREAGMTPRQRTQTYYGYSFESFCTSSTPHVGKQPSWSGDVNTNVQWCSVVKTKLGDTRLLLGGEVDCVRGTASVID
jgi:RAT1-interacting protein